MKRTLAILLSLLMLLGAMPLSAMASTEVVVENVILDYTAPLVQYQGGHFISENGNPYYYYDLDESCIMVEIQLSDGSVFKGSYTDFKTGSKKLFLDAYGLSISYTTSQDGGYSSRWEFYGQNSMHVTVGDCTGGLTLTMVEGALRSFTAEYVGTLVEGVDGYYDVTEDGTEYFHYEINENDLILSLELCPDGYILTLLKAATQSLQRTE